MAPGPSPRHDRYLSFVSAERRRNHGSRWGEYLYRGARRGSKKPCCQLRHRTLAHGTKVWVNGKQRSGKGLPWI